MQNPHRAFPRYSERDIAQPKVDPLSQLGAFHQLSVDLDPTERVEILDKKILPDDAYFRVNKRNELAFESEVATAPSPEHDLGRLVIVPPHIPGAVSANLFNKVSDQQACTLPKPKNRKDVDREQRDKGKR